jgi:hypothetical protein
MRQQLPCVQTHWRRARENRDYVRRLLTEREQVFLALCQFGVCQVVLEVACQ